MLSRTLIKYSAGCALEIVMMMAMTCLAHAAALPGPADAGRLEQREEQRFPELDLSNPQPPESLFPSAEAPAESKKVHLVIHDIHVEGLSAFAQDDLKDLYAPYLNRDVSLDTVWQIADRITDYYKNAGYFLTRTLVPQQEIKNGVITLQVIEGYIGEVEFNDPLAQNSIIKDWIDKLQTYRPLKADQVESILLSLNDLPGVNLHAVLLPLAGKDAPKGAVRLVLQNRPTAMIAGSVSFDNNGSRYLGPYEYQVQAQAVVIPTQRTSATFLTPMPSSAMKYGSLKHEFQVFPAATVELYGSYTSAHPGFTLKPEDIKTTSTSMGIGFDYSIIRQRQENMTGKIVFESHDTSSDILGTALTRDAVRALRLNLNYQIADTWDGQNSVNLGLSQGVNILGSSEPGQLNLSRASARPDFTKMNIDLSRQQALFENWSTVASLSAQLASEPLYSSEQFGYGGQAFGRAYDDSYITGDQGVEGSAELRYMGIASWNGFQPMPYGFYDVGSVWNIQDDSNPYASASSVGSGIRLFSDIGFSSNIGFAFPLTHKVTDPLYGNGKSPRYFMQASYNF